MWYNLIMHKNWEDQASFSDFIISHLFSCRSTKMRKNLLYEMTREKRELDARSFNKNLHRLENKGFIKYDDNNVFINKESLKSHLKFKNIKTSPTGDTRVLVLFDIPEKKKKIRNWIRLQLKLWDFEMIQKSVWMGNGPLPKEFGDHLNLLGVKNCVKVFKISKTS